MRIADPMHFGAASQVAWLRERDKVVTNHTCGPVANVSYEADGNLRAEEGDEVARAVANGTWRNIDARRVLRDEYGMGLVPVYNATVALWEMHRSNSAGKECRWARVVGRMCVRLHARAHERLCLGVAGGWRFGRCTAATALGSSASRRWWLGACVHACMYVRTGGCV